MVFLKASQVFLERILRVESSGLSTVQTIFKDKKAHNVNLGVSRGYDSLRSKDRKGIEQISGHLGLCLVETGTGRKCILRFSVDLGSNLIRIT